MNKMKLKDVISEYGEYEVDKEKLESVLVKPTGRWLPKEFEFYNCYDEENEMFMSYEWEGNTSDNANYKCHNVWRTRAECGKAVEIRIAFQNASFEPDWNDVNQNKVQLSLYFIDKKIDLKTCSYINYGCQYYFENEYIAQQLIEKYSYEDIAKYIFHVY